MKVTTSNNIIITLDPMEETRLDAFRVISTTDDLWRGYVSAELSKRTDGAVKLDDLLSFTTNLNDLYTLLVEGRFTFTTPNKDQDMNTLKRLSEAQLQLLNSLGYTATDSRCQREVDAVQCLADVRARLATATDAGERRVIRQLIKKLAPLAGEVLEVKTRKRMPNTLPEGVTKIKTSTNQALILQYLHNKFLSNLVVATGRTYTAINVEYASTASIYLGELKDHKLSTRSCATLIKRLEEVATTAPAPVTVEDLAPWDMITAAAPEAEAEPAPVMDLLSLIAQAEPEVKAEPEAEPAPAAEAEAEPAPEADFFETLAQAAKDAQTAPEPAPAAEVDFFEALAQAQVTKDAAPWDLFYDNEEAWGDEPTDEELAALEAEEEAHAIDQIELQELKLRHRHIHPSLEAAESTDEYHAALARLQALDAEYEAKPEVETVSLEDAGLTEITPTPDGYADLPLDEEQWGDAWEGVEKLLVDYGYTVEDGYITIHEDHARVLLPRLRHISLHGYQGMFVDDEYEDDVDDCIDTWHTFLEA